jgi:hypothetical protein
VSLVGAAEPDAILEAVGGALYRAKRSERNRAVIAGGSEQT